MKHLLNEWLAGELDSSAHLKDMRRARTKLVVMTVVVLMAASVLVAKGILQSWVFLARIQVGEDRQSVTRSLTGSYQVFKPSDFEALDRMLQDFNPRITWTTAAEVIVTPIGHDRFGVVVLSGQGRVMRRVVVRT